MASTTLGKRRRDDYTATSSLSTGPSRKKRALRSSINDENTPPSAEGHVEDDAPYGNEFEINELDDSFVAPRNASTRRSIAVGCTAQGSEVASAPAKSSDGHFKSIKTITRMSLASYELKLTNMIKVKK